MRTFTVLHLAEPRLGYREPPDGRRGRDRLAAFERVIDRALQSGADAVLVAGQMLAPEPPDPELLAGLDDLLARARAASVAMVATCERGAEAWLALLAGRDRLHLLVPGGPAGETPVAALGRGLEIAGLGQPADPEILARRAAALGPLPDDGTQRLALLSLPASAAAEPAGWTSALGAIATRVGYLALGGSPVPAVVTETARDPGPLTHIDLEDRGFEPGFLRVKVGPRLCFVEPIASEDRPLLRLAIDLTNLADPADLALEVRGRLTGVRSADRPLVRIELAGTPRFDRRAIDGQAIRSLVREVALASACEVLGLPDPGDPPEPRAGRGPGAAQEAEDPRSARLRPPAHDGTGEASPADTSAEPPTVAPDSPASADGVAAHPAPTPSPAPTAPAPAPAPALPSPDDIATEVLDRLAGDPSLATLARDLIALPADGGQDERERAEAALAAHLGQAPETRDAAH